MKRIGMLMMLAAGFAAGITFVYSCGGSSSSAATTVTEYLSLNGAAFQPKYSGYDYDIGSDGIWNKDGLSEDWEAPVILPHNATINWVKVYWTDNNAVENLRFQLRKYTPSDSLVETIVLGTSNETASLGSTVDDTVDQPIVDNESSTYTLLLTIPTSDIVFRMAVIEYEHTF